MNLNKHVASILIAGCLGFAGMGCEKPAETPVVPANPPAPAPQVSTPAAPTATMDKAVAGANSMSATATAEAQKLLDQVTEYVKDKKWDLADEALKKLEAMKASLPAEWASKIDQARSAFTTAKTAASAMPAMPGMPK